MRCCRHRDRYIALVIKKNMRDAASGKKQELTESDEDTMDRIEAELPMVSLVLFRQLGVKEALVQSRQAAKQADGDYKTKKKRFSVNIDVKASAKWLRRMSLSRREKQEDLQPEGLQEVAEKESVGEGDHSAGGGSSDVADEVMTHRMLMAVPLDQLLIVSSCM